MKPLFPSIRHARPDQQIGGAAKKRPSAARRGYDSNWRRRRTEHLAAHPWCVDCLAEGKRVKATQVDHDVPKTAGGEEDPSNYKSRCHSHHSRKTCKQDGGFGNPKRRAH